MVRFQNRREFLRTTAAAAVTTTLFPGIASGYSTSGKEKPMKNDTTGRQPNILLITTDQQHHRLMSCAGDPYVQTPNLDRLAASGMRFLQAYSPNPVCVPCRYSFMTGRMPHVFDGMETNRKRDHSLRPRIADHIDTPCIGHLVRSAGYDTVCGGKLHVESGYKYTDADETTYGFRCLTSDMGDGLADACAGYLARTHDKPFFLWASFDQPHDICKYSRPGYNDEHLGTLQPVPLPDNHAPTKNEPAWMTGFRTGTLGTEETIELGMNRSCAQKAMAYTDADWQNWRAVYRAWMEQADRQIGTVLDALHASGLQDNTVVIFTSDHGDHDGAHGLTMKRSFYEESAHIPFIISHPGHVAPGTTDHDHLVCNGPDLLPTVCDYAGIEVPHSMNGSSLRPAAEGRAGTWRNFVVSETMGGRMVRTGNYKYCLYCYAGTAEEMLFDLEADPGEMKNIAGDAGIKETVTRCRDMLTAWTEDEKDVKGKQYLALLQ